MSEGDVILILSANPGCSISNVLKAAAAAGIELVRHNDRIFDTHTGEIIADWKPR